MKIKFFRKNQLQHAPDQWSVSTALPEHSKYDNKKMKNETCNCNFLIPWKPQIVQIYRKCLLFRFNSKYNLVSNLIKLYECLTWTFCNIRERPVRFINKEKPLIYKRIRSFTYNVKRGRRIFGQIQNRIEFFFQIFVHDLCCCRDLKRKKGLNSTNVYILPFSLQIFIQFVVWAVKFISIDHKNNLNFWTYVATYLRDSTKN